MSTSIFHSPFTTALSGSAKETEDRIRNIFQYQKKRPPVPALLLACALVCSIGIFLTSVQHMFQTEAEYESGSHEVAFGTSGEGYFTREQALDLAAHHNIRRAGLVVEDESILIRSAEEGEE